jgi:D-sedoheptulose 7-phosphate isomerase
LSCVAPGGEQGYAGWLYALIASGEPVSVFERGRGKGECAVMTSRYVDELIKRRPQLAVCKTDMERFTAALITCYRSGGKVLVCGNGGSCSDAGHIVGELMKGFHFDRPPLRAIDLTAQTALITAIANDLGGDSVFAQQVLAYADPGDVFIGISTSGNAANVNNAAKTTRESGAVCVGLTGENGGEMFESGLYDVVVRVPENETFRIQEEHIAIYHAVCADVESEMFNDEKAVDDQYYVCRKACPVCDCDSNVLIYTQRFAPLSKASVVDSYDVCRCNKCGMVFANNIPSQAEFDEYYKNSNKYENTIKEWNDNWRNYWQIAVFDYIISQGGKNLRICDFGCGQGELIIRLNRAGCRKLYALDTSKANCGYLEQNGIQALCDSIFDINVDSFGTKFDIVICSAVLEHIVDIRGFLSRILNFVDTNGSIIISVPATCVDEGRKAPYQNLSTEHINYFTPGSLVAIMEQYGFEPKEILGGDETIMNYSFRRGYSSMEQYAAVSAKRIQEALDRLEHLRYNQTPLYVWGAGSMARQLMLNSAFGGFNIIAFADSNKHLQGGFLGGKPIIAPDKIDRNDALIFIAAYRDQEASIINAARNELHLINEIIPLLSSENEEAPCP